MQWSRGFQSCDRGLCRPDTLCNLGLRQAGFSTSLEYLVQKGKLVVETVICRLHRRMCQCPAPKLFERTRHVSLLSFGVMQFEVPLMESCQSSLRTSEARRCDGR